MRNIKDKLSGLLSVIFLFTFPIPVIPIAGVSAYNAWKPDNKEVTKTETPVSHTSSSFVTDEADEYEVEEEQSYIEDEPDEETDYAEIEEDDEYNGDDFESDDYSSGGYTNTYGNYVPSPTYEYDSDATAKCRDGTYSYSQSRRGTCSHHGGVAVWL